MEKEVELVKQKLKYLSSLNEVDSRNYLGLWAIEEGWGGISKVNKLTGSAIDTIRKGIKEVKSGNNIKIETGRLRKKGGGRKNIIDKNPEIEKIIENILEENTAGDPMSKLRWTNKSTYSITNELKNKVQHISDD